MSGLLRVKDVMPKAPRVVGEPTRDPVNMQAALITRKAAWIYQPLPPESAPKGELEKLRQECEQMKKASAQQIAHLAYLKKRLAKVEKRNADLTAQYERELGELKKRLAERVEKNEVSGSLLSKIDVFTKLGEV